MATIVVLGGGLCGLSSALLLAKDDHEVVVLERDPAPSPAPATAEEAWRSWERRGVNQFRMLHYFASRWLQVTEAEMPEVATALEAAGGLRANPIADAPDALTGGWQAGDERYAMLTGRRPVVEACLAAVVAAAPNVTVRRGVAVAELRTGTERTAGVPHVVGVRTDGGEDLDADLVVDAGGRRSPLPRLLEAAGAAAPVEEVEDSGFVYYGRYFRSPDGSTPPDLGGPLQHYLSVSTLTLPADNGTWGIGIVASGRDAELRRLADTDAWTRAVAAFPLVAHWLDGQPLDEAPAVMAKIEDRHRSYVVDGRPVATGVAAVGDSWACTNPSLGRGASIGAIHVQALRDVVRDVGLQDAAAFATAWAAATMDTVEPWYRATLAFDRHRLAEIDAQIAGRRYETDDPTWAATKAVEKASMLDGDVLRAFARVASVQELPEQALAEPGLLDKVVTLGAGWEGDVPPGPGRDELVAIVKG